MTLERAKRTGEYLIAVEAIDEAMDRARDDGEAEGVVAAAKGFFVAASWSAMFHAFVWHFWDRTKGGDEFHRTMWKSHERLSVALDAAIDEAESEVA